LRLTYGTASSAAVRWPDLTAGDQHVHPVKSSPPSSAKYSGPGDANAGAAAPLEDNEFAPVVRAVALLEGRLKKKWSAAEAAEFHCRF
jgi:hypothetical protein